MSGSSPELWAFLPNLYRFALVLTPDIGAASKAASSAIEDTLKKRDLSDPERAAAILYADVRRLCLKMPAPDPGAVIPAGDIAAALHRLPEPGRSALALLYLGDLNGEQIGRVLGLHTNELGAALSAARESLSATLALTEPAAPSP